jgi:hypothetical protein
MTIPVFLMWLVGAVVVVLAAYVISNGSPFNR